MKCEKEMNQFFARNCYSEKEREKVKASPAYRLAMEKDDAIEAQEIATRVLEGKEPAPGSVGNTQNAGTGKGCPGETTVHKITRAVGAL